MSIKILSGDIYQIRGQKKALSDDFLADNSHLAFEYIDLEDQAIELGDLLNRLSVSMLSPNKMVILENLSRSDLKDKIELIFQRNQIDLVIVEPQLDKKTSFGKFLSQQPGFLEYKPRKGPALQSWLCQRAGEMQTSLSPGLAGYLIERVGEDQVALENEIQKLRVYPSISRDLIDQLVVANQSSQIFDLLNELIGGRLNRALDLYEEQRQQKNQPISILGSIVWQLEILLIAKNSRDSADKISRDFAIHVFPVRKAQTAVKTMSGQYLHKLIDLCLQTDRRIRHDFADPDEALLFLITKGCSLKSQPAR